MGPDGVQESKSSGLSQSSIHGMDAHNHEGALQCGHHRRAYLLHHLLQAEPQASSLH